jgi:outer membrane lipoprotein-sorting protein
MRNLRRLGPVAAAILLCLFLISCSARRIITRGRAHRPVNGTAPALKVATREDLNAIIARTYNAVHSFQAANVNLTVSEGNLYAGIINDYTTVPGVILFNKEDNIRVQASAALVGLLFDMVSDGTNFRLQLPKKNLFVEGLNSAAATSTNKIENLRPEAFLSSMLIRPVDPATEFAMLKDDTDEDNALYRLELNGKKPDGTPFPGRDIWFDREDLSIVRQKIYDDKGNIVSDTSYSLWQTFKGVPFPVHIDINRRIDGYGVVIEIDKDKMEMNKEIAPEKFDLPQPQGYTVKVIR